MPKAVANKPYVNFTGGLVTEATGLTYPENTAQDLLNCDLHKSGMVSRRYGLHPELNLTGTSRAGFDPSYAVSIHDWPSPAGRDDLHFVVVQMGVRLYFRQFTEDGNLSSTPTEINASTQTLDVDAFAYLSPTSTQRNQSHLDSARGQGRLFMTGNAFEPFVLEYDPDTQLISVFAVGNDEEGVFGFEESKIFIRDFKGVNDGLEVYEQPTVATMEHTYNLINQGWWANRIDQYKAASGVYPSNAQQQVLGKDAEENFSPEILDKQDFGTSAAPKGRFLLSALYGDREDAEVLFGLPFDFGGEENEPAAFLGSFSTCAFFAGRFWMSGDRNPKRPNGVYFSQVIQDIKDAGKCYQQNDPASEHFTELYDDDGGVIYIQEAQQIVRIRPFLQGMVVWATNGVWYIRGGEAGFTAAEFAVEKIASIQCESPRSIVEVEDSIMFMANSGIYAVTTPDGLTASVTKASSTIETYYNDISVSARKNAWAVYDRLSEKVMWLYHDSSDLAYNTTWHNKILVYDTSLNAFSPLETNLYDDGAGNLSGVAVAIPSPFRNKVMAYDTLTTLTRVDEDAEVHLKFIVVDYDGTDAVWWAEEMSSEFYTDTLGASTTYYYSSFIETGAEWMDDLASDKRVTYVYSFFEPIEEQFFTDNDETFAYPLAGCTVTFKWDWHRSANGNRWSRPQQAYRRRRPITDDRVDNGAGIVYTKLKARGKGKALSIRYESTDGAAFRLLGFNVEFTA